MAHIPPFVRLTGEVITGYHSIGLRSSTSLTTSVMVRLNFTLITSACSLFSTEDANMYMHFV